MRVICLGAARTVTGSCFLVEMDNGICFLVDCGLHQGGKPAEINNYTRMAYRVPDLKAIFLTHAHIDHSGLVPRLVRDGYRGPVYATEATCDLLKYLWLDAAHIQEMEAEWKTKKNRRQGYKGIAPLYETADAEAAMRQLEPVDLDKELTPLPGIMLKCVTAGHILGAASLRFTLPGSGGLFQLGFSGDIGRPGQLIVPDPETMPSVDMLFMETTYGNRLHKSLEESITELLTVVKEAYRDRGKVIIPAFAVERTQEIIYTLARAREKGEFPEDMPVFLDSPLAIHATEVFQENSEFYGKITKGLLTKGLAPINLPNLTFTPTTLESQKINEVDGPAVIIAGNGMASAGRIKHHLKHNLWRPNCHVVIVGFQAEGTVGRKLVEGASQVRILREEVAVKAKIHTIGGFSAHADQAELLTWLSPLSHPGLNVNLIHGEEKNILDFQKIAQARFPEVKFNVPTLRESIDLRPQPVEVVPKPTWTPERIGRLKQGLSGFESRLDDLAARNPAILLAMEQALEEAERAR